MATAITLVTPQADGHVSSIETSYSYYYDAIATNPGPPPTIIYTRVRTKTERKTYTWTAKGPKTDRDLPAAQQASPGSGWYLDGKGFTPQGGSDTAALADDNIYGTYRESYSKIVSYEYLNASDEWVTIT